MRAVSMMHHAIHLALAVMNQAVVALREARRSRRRSPRRNKQPEAKKLMEKEPKKKRPREKAEEKKHKETEAIASQAAAGEEPGEGKDKVEPKQGDPGGGGRPRRSRRRAVRQAWQTARGK